MTETIRDRVQFVTETIRDRTNTGGIEVIQFDASKASRFHLSSNPKGERFSFPASVSTVDSHTYRANQSTSQGEKGIYRR